MCIVQVEIHTTLQYVNAGFSASGVECPRPKSTALGKVIRLVPIYAIAIKDCDASTSLVLHMTFTELMNSCYLTVNFPLLTLLLPVCPGTSCNACSTKRTYCFTNGKLSCTRIRTPHKEKRYLPFCFSNFFSLLLSFEMSKEL